VGALGFRLWGCGAWLPSPDVTVPTLVVHHKRYERYDGDSPENLTARVSPFKFTRGHQNRTDTDRSATYDFLLVIYRNREPRGLSSEFCDGGEAEINSNDVPTGKSNIVTISAFV